MAASLSSKEFSMMQRYIEEQCGIMIGSDKAYLIESRLSKLLVDFCCKSFEELYYKICASRDRKLAEQVIDAITTNETLWFRDKSPWDILEQVLLPDFIRELREGRRSKVHIWSAACSTGQEPYSTAMCIDRYLTRHGIRDVGLQHFDILASDISKTVLEVGRAGRYDSISILRGLDDSCKTTYFKNQGRVWEISDKIKEAVRFQQFNLQNCFLFLQRFDLIFCRYVTIYFSGAFKKELFGKMANVLNNGGVLFLGSSEIFPDYGQNFIMEQHNGGVYYRGRGSGR